ncbi:response regulator transcription factor [Ferdinandcohnia quinoae]|uniref:Response regulator n=1 Tax=Fredinandcohnia quinoae TaxID=2918902 RepID=A0AAW5E055_9BACI|nr:response regulator [Fredinandcohnia sp. SECRCQ15]MCH1624064.1 response regulator [Fredinandcohnia sp. SECRCQ15]
MYKLMITEDEPLVREGLKQYFNWRELGFRDIFEAENGRHGIDIALLEKPDLVITDIRMPVMDGLEMIGQLRKDLPNTLFIILTGYSEFKYAKKAIQFGGVQDYLLKPLQYEESLLSITNSIKILQNRKHNSNTVLHFEKDSTKNTNEADTSDMELFQQIETYIKDHIEQDLTLSNVADHFFYNPSYLSRLFKIKLNKNYMAFVSEIRIKFAQRCLEQPHYSVTDVSKMAGYKSYKHFVKVFKGISQMTPTEYRKKLRM